MEDPIDPEDNAKSKDSAEVQAPAGAEAPEPVDGAAEPADTAAKAITEIAEQLTGGTENTQDEAQPNRIPEPKESADHLAKGKAVIIDHIVHGGKNASVKLPEDVLKSDVAAASADVADPKDPAPAPVPVVTASTKDGVQAANESAGMAVGVASGFCLLLDSIILMSTMAV